MEKKYFYVDIAHAKKGNCCIKAVTEEPIPNYNIEFEGKACEYYGEDVPHHIKYDEKVDKIFACSNVDLIKMGKRELQYGQYISGDEIKEYNPATQKLVDGEAIDKTREDMVSETVITVESEQDKARFFRGKLFAALDTLDSKLAVGRIPEKMPEYNEEEVNAWYKIWQDLPSSYTNINVAIEDSYPETPACIAYFM